MGRKDNIVERDNCGVCAAQNFKQVLSLPKLPLTGRFSRERPRQIPSGIDQNLLMCSTCGHVQLGRFIDPVVLYDDTYSFRTSLSAKARAGTEFFLSSLSDVVGERSFECVVDVGCNDLYLLKRLAGRARARVGIDPIWEKKKNDQADIRVIGGTVEHLDLRKVLPCPPDLIVCRHTLEHIAHPKQVLEQLMAGASDDAVLCFEVPGFDVLMEKYRFDQIFHEHLNYYSLAILRRLIEEVGGEYLGHRENRHDWGALFIAFRKSAKRARPKSRGPYSGQQIKGRYAAFRSMMDVAARTLAGLPDPVYGFGGAQMLPVLAYHMQTDLSRLQAILDDDPAKAGLWYWNLPVKIISSGPVDLKDVSILLTALDNAEPILKRLLADRPRNVIVPMAVI